MKLAEALASVHTGSNREPSRTQDRKTVRRSLRYFLPSYGNVLSAFRNGLELVWAHHNRRQVNGATFHDGQRIVNVGDRAGFVDTLVEVWGLQEYTRDGFYTPRNGDTVIDLGANIGLFSIWIARHAPEATILALEPFAENFTALKRNLVGWRHDIQPHNLAVGHEAGVGRMVDTGERSLDHRLANDREEANGNSVEVITLNDVLGLGNARMVDLLKIDVEGAEADILAATTPATLSRVRRLTLEYHDNIRAGTLQRVRDLLSPTHRIVDVHGGSYGILRAELLAGAGTRRS